MMRHNGRPLGLVPAVQLGRYEAQTRSLHGFIPPHPAGRAAATTGEGTSSGVRHSGSEVGHVGGSFSWEAVVGIIAWILLGLISGFIASKLVNKTGEGLLVDILLGIVGAFVGGFVFTHFFGANGVTGFNLYSMFVAVIGAVIVLLLYHLIFRRRAI
jgi:uncharacterized membrane protein YeaQ/YmgE (transglycosylase-associated protein family)